MSRLAKLAGVARQRLRSKSRCSFCDPTSGSPEIGHFRAGKSAIADLRDSDAVGRLVAGPSVYMCDECIKACVEVLEQHGGLAPSPGADKKTG